MVLFLPGVFVPAIFARVFLTYDTSVNSESSDGFVLDPVNDIVSGIRTVKLVFFRVLSTYFVMID
jgi:hypothetical protein